MVIIVFNDRFIGLLFFSQILYILANYLKLMEKELSSRNE